MRRDGELGRMQQIRTAGSALGVQTAAVPHLVRGLRREGGVRLGSAGAAGFTTVSVRPGRSHADTHSRAAGPQLAMLEIRHGLGATVRG